MLSQIIHDRRFRYSASGRCPLVTDLEGMEPHGKADGKALQDSHRNAGQGHMHFNGTYCFQNLFARSFTFHTFQRARGSRFLVIT